MRSFLSTLRSAPEPGPGRVTVYIAILFALELAGVLFLVAGTHGLIVPLHHPTTTDFASFYAAGALVDAGTPQLAYNQAAHYIAEQAATAPGISYVSFFYPPVFLLLCAALPVLPYLAAFAAFELVTLVPCLLVAQRILDDRRWSTLLTLLAFPAVLWNIGIGQNAFLTAALFGAATLLVDRRPGVAGLLFGALCYKPHFALLVPVALAAGGRWRAFLGAAVSATALSLLSLGLLGVETWRAFLAAAVASPPIYAGNGFDHSAFLSPFAAVLMLGGSIRLAAVIQTAASLAVAALVAVVWRRALDLPLRAATLIAATLVAIPVALIYDLVLGGMAMAWLVRLARRSGFLPWERLMLTAVFVLPLFSRNLGTLLHWPFTPLAAWLLLAIVLRRVGRALRAPGRPGREVETERREGYGAGCAPGATQA